MCQSYAEYTRVQLRVFVVLICKFQCYIVKISNSWMLKGQGYNNFRVGINPKFSIPSYSFFGKGREKREREGRRKGRKKKQEPKTIQEKKRFNKTKTKKNNKQKKTNNKISYSPYTSLILDPNKQWCGEVEGQLRRHPVEAQVVAFICKTCTLHMKEDKNGAATPRQVVAFICKAYSLHMKEDKWRPSSPVAAPFFSFTCIPNP